MIANSMSLLAKDQALSAVLTCAQNQVDTTSVEVPVEVPAEVEEKKDEVMASEDKEFLSQFEEEKKEEVVEEEA